MENQTQEKLEIINKATELNQFIKSIINDNKELNFIDITKIQKIANLNETLLNKLTKDELEIAIIGLEKAGKSTFANALIESNIFPSAAERCTYTITRLTYGEDRAIVTFYTEEEFNERFIDLLNTIKYPNIDKNTLKTLKIEDFTHYFNSLEENQPELYNTHKGKAEIEIKDILLNKDKLLLDKPQKVFLGDEILSQEFKSYITGNNDDRSKPYSVKSIDIQSSKLSQLKNAVIYDVPGFDSTTQLHTEQTTERLKSADVIILITNVGQNPNIQGTVLNILKEQVDEDGLKLKEKLFIFGNKKDTANTLEQANNNHQILLKDVINLGIGTESTVCTGSALKYLSLKNIAEDKYKNNFDIEDNIHAFRELIIKYHQTDRFNLVKMKLENVKQDFIKEIQVQLHNHQLESMPSSEEDAKHYIFTKASTELQSKFKKAISNIRTQLKAEIIGFDNKTNRTLTEKLQNRFDEKSNFPQITESNLDEIIRETDKSVSLELNEATNPYLRNKISTQIRQNISDVIRDFFEQNGKEKEAQIIENLLNELNPERNIAVRNELIQFIQNVRTENIYSHEKYEYLFERFARNLFDIFNYSLGSNARTQKFNNAKKDFIYLDAYYCEDKDEDFKLISLLLTQKSEDESTIELILKKIYKAIGDWIKNDTFHIDKAKETIGVLKNFFAKGSDSEKKEESIITTKKLFDLVDAKDIAKHANKSATRTEILHEINTDITNIKDIIRNAVIKAMDIETVFFNSFDKQLSTLQEATEIDNCQYNRYQTLINRVISINYSHELSNIAKAIEQNHKKRELLSKLREFVSRATTIC